MQVCTSLQTDNHASIPPLSFFTGRMPFLLPNQQRQSTEGSGNLAGKWPVNGDVVFNIVSYLSYMLYVSICFLILLSSFLPSSLHPAFYVFRLHLLFCIYDCFL